MGRFKVQRRTKQPRRRKHTTATEERPCRRTTPQNPAEKNQELLATKSPSGVDLFKDIRGKVGQWRMERTADQVIKYLEEEKAKLIKDDGDAFPEDIPYDETPLSPEEEAKQYSV